MPSSHRNRYLRLSLLASLLVHVLLLWVYQHWAAEQTVLILQPIRFTQGPSTSTPRFEPRLLATVPSAVMEQLRRSQQLPPRPPEIAITVPPLQLQTAPPNLRPELESKLQPEVLPGDTLDFGSTLQDLYRRGTLELSDGRLFVLPLADVTSEAGHRRARAEQIIAQAIEAIGGLAKLQAVRDKRIRVERRNDRTSKWEPAGIRYYRRGTQYRTNLAPGLARGFDGRRSWFYRYGLLLLPRDERNNADRWDFLSKFRGDGIVVEYIGQRRVQNKTLETIRVTDTKYNRQRLAYFDVRDSLLESETEAGVTTHYIDYQWTSGVLTPFEVWIASPCPGCLARYRWNTELNLDLSPDRFAMPASVTWDPKMVRKVIFEHASVPVEGPTSVNLQLESLTQSLNPDTGRPYLDQLSLQLLDQYLERKLKRAGVLTGENPGNIRIRWNIDEFYDRFGLPWATIKISVSLKRPGSDDEVWQGLVDHRWKRFGIAIDDRRADALTYQVISLISSGMKELQEARVTNTSR